LSRRAKVYEDPAGLAKNTAVRLATAGDLLGESRGMQWLAIFVVVLPPICLQDNWL
jgi:hypothetical protein